MPSVRFRKLSTAPAGAPFIATKPTSSIKTGAKTQPPLTAPKCVEENPVLSLASTFRILLAAVLTVAALPGEIDHLAAVRSGLADLAVDPSQTWRVRDLELSRGGAKIYFSEGVLAFATPVDGHRIAAVFTTTGVEAGDAEVIALPPIPAERASLARFTQSPNLDEHFGSALLFFADDIAGDLLRQIHDHPLHPASDLAPGIAATFHDLLTTGASGIDVRITQSILDRHSPANGFLYCMMAGRTLGAFDVAFQPGQPDPLVFGRVALATPQTPAYFQIWSAFRSRNAPEPAANYQLTDYHIDTTIHAGLSMSSIADFDYEADADDGAVVSLLLSPRLRVTAATIDGHSAPVLMHDSPLISEGAGASRFLVVNDTELTPGSHHRMRIKYEGSVIRRGANGTYFVDDRNLWYPFSEPMLTVFDLTFHCPKNLRLFSTGDPISESIEGDQRLIHRRTAVAQALAGFNLGQFTVTEADGRYHIEVCSNPALNGTPSGLNGGSPDLAGETAQILQYFTNRWMPLSNHNLAVTPIEGYFGQGFPGLIYLSNYSYLRERDRPAGLRNAAFDSFFSQLLLPHELAHQWWGNIVTPLDYRSTWIVEAMANYAALQYLEQAHGHGVVNAILTGYRTDLVTPREAGELVDSNGPVTFSQRLLNNFGPGVWHDVLYEKGTWIIHMLHARMGDAAFHQFQVRVINDFAKRPISNEDLRAEAAHFIPASQPDRQLTAFFDTWVYDTGVPALSIKRGSLTVAKVPDTYAVDLPLECGASKTLWIRATEGTSELGEKACGLPDPAKFLYRRSDP